MLRRNTPNKKHVRCPLQLLHSIFTPNTWLKLHNLPVNIASCLIYKSSLDDIVFISSLQIVLILITVHLLTHETRGGSKLMAVSIDIMQSWSVYWSSSINMQKTWFLHTGVDTKWLPDGSFIQIFLFISQEIVCILFKISQEIAPGRPFGNKPSLVDLSATGDKPSSSQTIRQYVTKVYMGSSASTRHYMTSQWGRWRLKSPASRLFTQPFIHAQIKANIKAPRHWPLCGKVTGDRWIPRTKGQWGGK